MAWDATDWTITRATKVIDYTGDDHGGASPTYVNGLEFHRQLQDYADDPESTGDDQLAITDVRPSSRAFDGSFTLLNGYTITAAAAEHIYDATIFQDGGNTRFDAVTNYGNFDVQIQIIQDGAVLADDFWNVAGAGINADANQGISHRFLLQTRVDGHDIDGRRILGTTRAFGNTYGEFLINGTGEGPNVLALVDSDDGNNNTAAGTVSGWTGITVAEGYNSQDVDNDTTDEDYADLWNTNQPTRSINEFYERTKWLTRDGTASTLHGINGELFRGITHEITYDTVAFGGPVENNYLAWGTTFNYDAELASGLTVGEYYTFQTSGAVGQLLALDDDGTTGFCVFAIEPGSGTVVDTESFIRSDGTATDGADVNSTPVGTADVGGWALVIADDASALCWVQILKGVPPTDGMVMYEATSAGVHDVGVDGTAAVNVTVTAYTISTPFIGTSTGSALFGAYAWGVEKADLTKDDRLQDLTDTQITPPNLVTFTVSGLAIGEDYVIVAPWDGVTTDLEGNPAFEKDQLILDVALTTGAETAVDVTAIPSDTPDAPNLRVVTNGGEDQLCNVTSWTGSVFTIDSESFSGDNASINNDVYITYLDKLAASADETFQFVYSGGDRDFVVLVRDGDSTPIVEFIQAATMGINGGSVNVIRQSDE